MTKARARPKASPTLPARIQRRLENLYGVEAPSVDAFVHSTGEAREVLEVRPRRGAIEIRLHLPKAALCEGASLTLDELCQVAEGVSHYLYLAERARRELPATQLELELQAEVDKFLLLSALSPTHAASRGEASLSGHRLREKLFEKVRFLHPEGTETGDRYRFANYLAARFALKLERALARGVDRVSLRRTLRTFFGVGQREKIEMALAA